MTTPTRTGVSRALVWMAGAAGMLHAACCRQPLLGTRRPVAAGNSGPVGVGPLAAGLALGLVALVKVLAAAIPIGVAYGRIPGARFWRAVSWTGGLLLIAYGGTNTIVSGAVLAGLIQPEGGYDPASITGHALLWDPLFFAWGAALILALWFSRPVRAPA